MEINSYKGFINHKFLTDILEEFLKSKDIDINITLKDLHAITNIRLYFYGTKIDNYSLQELSHKTTPDMSVILASTISCPAQHCLPLFDGIASSYNFKVMPFTLYPSSFINAATTEESTPPDIATTTLVSFLFLLIPREFMI